MSYQPVHSIVSKRGDKEMANEESDREEEHPRYDIQTEVRLPVLTVRNLND